MPSSSLLLPVALCVSLLVILQLEVCNAKQQYTLNVPRVLLPLVPTSGVKSNFTITSTHGCFTWYEIGSRVWLCKYCWPIGPALSLTWHMLSPYWS